VNAMEVLRFYFTSCKLHYIKISQIMIKICVARMSERSAFLASLLVALPMIASAEFTVSVKPLASRVVQQEPRVTRFRMPTTWDVLPGDVTVQMALGRWAEISGWTLIWRDVGDLPMKGQQGVLIYRDFLSVADFVITTAKADGYKLKATAYSNNVLVISKAD